MSGHGGGETCGPGAPEGRLAPCSRPEPMGIDPQCNGPGASPPSAAQRAACGKRAGRSWESHPAAARAQSIAATAMQPLAAPCSLVGLGRRCCRRHEPLAPLLIAPAIAVCCLQVR